MPYWKQNGDGYVLMFHRGNNKNKKKGKNVGENIAIVLSLNSLV